MNVLAIYAINEHIADLHEEARRDRLAREAKTPAAPSLLRRSLASARSAFRAATANSSPTAASAA
jgi:hypothetical protein